jgi:hypothetical protein
LTNAYDAFRPVLTGHGMRPKTNHGNNNCVVRPDTSVADNKLNFNNHGLYVEEYDMIEERKSHKGSQESSIKGNKVLNQY